MDSDTKVNISPDELIVLSNTNFLLTKRALTEKIYQLFGTLSDQIKAMPQFIAFNFPEGTNLTGKISRGENYQGLPYIILDMPGLFKHNNVLAYRTMMWWGHYFTFTLHLSGEVLDQYRAMLIENIAVLRNTATYISVSEHEWAHKIDAQHYLLIDQLQEDELINLLEEKPFIKLARKIELSEYDLVSTVGVDTLIDLLKVMGD